MDNKIFVELFKFNHKTDYLPYYKKYEIIYKNGEIVLDLLNKINEIEKFTFDGVEEFGVKINNLFVTVDTPIDDIVVKTSKEFVIEPVSSYRAVNDLTINNEDFMKKLAMFDQFLSDEQKESYKKELQLTYYSSNTLNFNKEYIGDHMLIIANDIIEDDISLKDNVLNILKDTKNGAWFHTSLEKRLLNFKEENKIKIEYILDLITNNQIKVDSESEIKKVEVKQPFTDFNIAVYDKNDTSILEELVSNSDAKCINTISKNDDLALHCKEIDRKFTYKIAGNFLLDAKDNNADFVIVKDEEIFKLFDNEQKEISKAVGRDIDLPIVTVDQFNELSLGEKNPEKLGFNEHKVAVEFL